MSGRKGKQNGESSKARKSSKSSESSESSEPSKPSKPSESSESSNPKVVESGSSSSEPETSSDTLADVKDGEGSDESGQETIESQLLALGLAEHHVDPDGNCMFESIARHLHEMNHQVLRQAACDYLQRNSEYSRVWGIEDFENQLNALRQDGEYANDLGDIVPEAIHNVTKRDIVIIQNRQNQISFSSKANITNSTIVIVRRDIHYSSTKPLKSEPKNQEMLDMAPNDSDSLVIGGLNVCSLLTTNAAGKKKKNLVRKLIKENKLDILVVGESMLRESTTPRRQDITSDPLHIDGYIYVRQDRYFINKNASGGLVVYIREDIEFKKRSDWEWPENNVQFVEISITEPARFDLVAIYSPPRIGHAQYVINLMEFFLKRNKPSNIPVMFVGDLNIDPGNDANASKAFTEFKAQFHTRQLITAKTRKKRCIDHIITNIPEQDMGSVDAKVVDTVRKLDDSQYISDHRLVLCSVKKSSQPAKLSISQPKECGDINLQVVLSNLIKDSQTKHISLKMICEFKPGVKTKGVPPPSDIRMSPISDRSISFDFKIEAPNEVIKRLAEVNKLITEIKNNNGQAPVVTKQCTICIVHKQTKSLHISDESKPWSVGGVDCFLINCSADQIPKVEPFLHKFHVCDQTDCFELFRTEPNVRHHKMSKHFYCPYCTEAPRKNLKKLGGHIKKEHLYICDHEDCMEEFTDDTELKEHNNEHPKYVNENLNHGDNKCKKCDTSYASREQLTYHYASKHFICIQCSVKLSSKQCTMGHLATQHFITWCPDKCCSKYFGPNEDMFVHQRDFHHY